MVHLKDGDEVVYEQSESEMEEESDVEYDSDEEINQILKNQLKSTTKTPAPPKTSQQRKKQREQDFAIREPYIFDTDEIQEIT